MTSRDPTTSTETACCSIGSGLFPLPSFLQSLYLTSDCSLVMPLLDVTEAGDHWRQEVVIAEMDWRQIAQIFR